MKLHDGRYLFQNNCEGQRDIDSYRIPCILVINKAELRVLGGLHTILFIFYLKYFIMKIENNLFLFQFGKLNHKLNLE